MSDRSTEYSKLLSLTEAALNGAATDAELKELRGLLKSDPAARSVYIDYLDVHVGLKWALRFDPLLADAENAGELPGEKRVESSRTVLGQLSTGFQAFGASIISPHGLGVMAVLLSVATFLLWNRLPFSGHDTTQTAGSSDTDLPQQVVAQVTQVIGGSWSDHRDVLAAGQDIFVGQDVVIEEGIAQIILGGGVEVNIEGPSRFRVDSKSSGFLHSGKLAARISQPGSHITVETSLISVRDLGTEIGVQVDDKSVEAHVLEGKAVIESASESVFEIGEGRTLSQGESVYVDSRGTKVSWGKAEPSKFARVLPSSLNPRALSLRYVGAHEGIGEYLRSTSVPKPLDGDEDGVYGTAGYYFFNSNDSPGPFRYVEPLTNLVYTKPEFLVDSPGGKGGLIPGSGCFSVIGIPNYLDIDDPSLRPAASVPNINSGILVYSVSEEEEEERFRNIQRIYKGMPAVMCSFRLGEGIPAAGFRMGVFSDNADLKRIVPTEIVVTVRGREARTGVVNVDLEGDLFFFDVINAKEGDVISIKSVLSLDHHSAIGGVVFDPL